MLIIDIDNPDEVVHTSKVSTQEADAEGLWIWGQPRIHKKFLCISWIHKDVLSQKYISVFNVAGF